MGSGDRLRRCALRHDLGDPRHALRAEPDLLCYVPGRPVTGILLGNQQKNPDPAKVIVVTGVFTACVAGFFPLAIVAELVNMGTLVAFAIVAVGILLLRVQRPDLVRPFSCPFVPVVPLLCVGSCAFLIFHLNYLAHLMFVLWLCIGIAFYALYGMHHGTRREGPATCSAGVQPVTPDLSLPVTGPDVLLTDTPSVTLKKQEGS